MLVYCITSTYQSNHMSNCQQSFSLFVLLNINSIISTFENNRNRLFSDQICTCIAFVLGQLAHDMVSGLYDRVVQISIFSALILLIKLTEFQHKIGGFVQCPCFTLKGLLHEGVCSIYIYIYSIIVLYYIIYYI